MAVTVRLGNSEDVGAALSVYEEANLARRLGHWPNRAPRLTHVAKNLRDAASWFLVAHDEGETVGMASVLPFRADRGAGPVIPGTSFLDLIYVLPDRWGQGIGTAVLDKVIDEAARRGCARIYLWTHDSDNERAQRLYLAHRFRRTGTTGRDELGEPVAQWVRDG